MVPWGRLLLIFTVMLRFLWCSAFLSTLCCTEVLFTEVFPSPCAGAVLGCCQLLGTWKVIHFERSLAATLDSHM
jgi:hypothetical protein